MVNSISAKEYRKMIDGSSPLPSKNGKAMKIDSDRYKLLGDNYLQFVANLFRDQANYIIRS